MSQLASDSLLWIKAELDSTLKHARQALEAYVEEPAEKTPLQDCLKHLHQVQGTLRIVEVYGAATLAEEMEAVAQALLDERIKGEVDEAYEVLMRAILQLPDYLERVIHGQRDMPLALLSLLNDLRSVRGEPLLSEASLFAQDLTSRGAKAANLSLASDGGDIVALAKKLRPKFQTALLGWFKSGDDANLQTLSEIAGELEHASGTPGAFQLWWIVGGVIEGMLDQGIDASVSLKQLLGQVDRQIKRLLDNGEAAFNEEPPTELVNNLLYYIGKSTSSGERVAGIKESFKLTDLLPADEQLALVRESLSGPNASLMHTVGGALKEDLAGVKDMLDIHVRMGKTDAKELEPALAILKKVSDTLGMLELPRVRAGVDRELQELTQMIQGSRSAESAALLESAANLIQIELTLDNHLNDPKRASEADNEADDFQEVASAVVRECIINLARVKDALGEYIKTNKKEGLEPLPGLLHQIQSGLQMLDEQRAASLFDSLKAYLQQRIFGQSSVPPQQELDRMADAVVSVEFYLETIQQGRGAQPVMLDNAEACVEALGLTPAALSPETSAAPEEQATDADSLQEAPAEDEPLSLAESDKDVADEKEESPADEVPSLEGLEVNEDDSALEIPEVEAPAAEATPAQPPAVPAKPALAIRPEEVDPEIVEIFLEESQEELASLREHFPRWKNAPENTESLTTVRRSFHTLKGSGRMVGAEMIGEYAWSIENLLNRIIDQTIEVTDETIVLLESSIQVLPELIEQLEVGTTPQTDVQLIMAQADAMGRGEPLPQSADMPASEEPAAEQIDQAAAIEMPPVAAEDETGDDVLHFDTDAVTETEPAPEAATLDPVLCDIFNREAQGHILVLEEFVATGPAKPSQDLLRALHTLHGSSSMSGITVAMHITAPVEKYVLAAVNVDNTLDADGLQLLADLAAALREVLEALPEPAMAGINADDFAQRANSLREALPESSITEDTPTRGEVTLLGDEDAFAADDSEVEMDDASSVVNEPATESPAGTAPRQTSEPLREVAVSDLENFDAELAGIFQEEANDLLEAMDASLHAWAEEKNNPEHVAALQRDLHTLKGGARMAGITPMGDLGHEMETVFGKVVDGHTPVSAEMFAVTQRAVDRLHRMLEQLFERHAIVDGGDLIRDMHAFLAAGDEAQTVAKAGSLPEESTTTDDVASIAAPPEQEDSAPEEDIEVSEVSEQQAAAAAGDIDRRSAPRIQQEMVRVRGELIESLLNAAGEVSIYRARLDQQMSTMGFNLTEMDNTVVRLREQLRKLEMETEAQIVYQWEKEGGEGAVRSDFDPLEMDRYSLLQQLSRGLSETVSDLVSIQQLLSQQSREAETLLLQQSRINTELQDGLMRTRMLPFSRHAQRLRRIVRQTADEVNKQAELKLIGAEGEMDRQILERILGPLEHMMRNAVIHGIEEPGVRERAGKPASGAITIRLFREGSDVVMRVSDDGAGLNIDAIRKKAEKQGLIKTGAKLPDDDIVQFVLESGFSTAETVTQSAGRGVGMDVVNNEIRQLGGSLRIHNMPGKGAEFVIRLPFTLAITQSLLVNVAEEAYAIPMPSIEGIVRLPRHDLLRYMQEEAPVFSYGGMDYNLQYLGVLLGLGAPQLSEELDTVPVLLVRAGEHSSALVTEGMLGNREIVVKSVGPQITSIRGIAGATLLGDGSIVLILDTGDLVRAAAAAAAQGEVKEQAERISEEEKAEDTTVAMVVDDSITVRRVTQRLLERYGMRVITAKDGVDALAVLQEQVPDVMLLDIEMPRMDGYELAGHMRNDDRFKEIPIIMITSRTGEKHRNRAMELGVNIYLGKPYQESEVLEHIAALVGKFNPERTRWE